MTAGRSPSGVLVLPVDITHLYDAAKKSVLYVEILPKRIGVWVGPIPPIRQRVMRILSGTSRQATYDAGTMPSFRDALDHLVEASARQRGTSLEAGHILLAAEHLGIVVADAMQEAATAVLVAARQLDGRPLRRWYRAVPDRASLRLRDERIATHFEHGRQAKGKADTASWINASAHFEDALQEAVELLEVIRHAPLRARPIVFGLISLASGLLGILVAERFFP